jgi:hypothetical protein
VLAERPLVKKLHKGPQSGVVLLLSLLGQASAELQGRAFNEDALTCEASSCSRATTMHTLKGSELNMDIKRDLREPI